MRIRELLEGKNFNDLQFIEIDDDGNRKLGFDLIEDLTFFMNNNDNVYRHFVYPSVSKCVDNIKLKKTTSPSIFEKAVKEAYKHYVESFPLKELPENIDENICKQVCEKMHEDTCRHASEGMYKE